MESCTSYPEPSHLALSCLSLCGRCNVCNDNCRELVSQNVMVLEKMGRYTSIKATSTIASASFPR